jgi:hypothetical protein
MLRCICIIDAHFDQCFSGARLLYAEAMRRPDATEWQDAMEEEKAAFFANDIWRIVPIDHSWNLLSSKWVFKFKCDDHGHIARYRARLVPRASCNAKAWTKQELGTP